MQDIQTYSNETLGATIRTVVDDTGDPHFVLKDVCAAFGETNYRRVSARLDADEKGVSQIVTPGGAQSMTTVNEPGLYSALFAMQPEKARGVPSDYINERVAKLSAFKRWVTHEVLPSIRRRGGYLVAAADETPEQTIARALILANDALKKKDARLAELEPKGKVFDACLDGDRWYTFTDASHLLRQTNGEITRTKLFDLAINDRIITADHRASRYGIDRGYVVDYIPPAGFNQRTGQPIPRKQYAKITTKGLRWMLKRYCQEG